MTTLTILRTTFIRHHLLLARLGWVAIGLLILSMIVANLPYVYRDTYNEWQVGEAMTAALRLFPTRNAFLYTLISLRLITLSIFTFTALFLAWRKWNDWFVLYVSATLLMLGYFFGAQLDIEIIRYPYWLWQHFPAIRAIAPSLIVINMVLFFYLFPNGRFSPRWLIWFTLPAILFIVIFMGEVFRFANPLNSLLEWLLPDNTDWWLLFTSTLIGTILLGLIAQLVRYWQSPAGAARQQTKWVLFGLAAIPLIPLLESWLANLLQVDASTQHLLSLFMGIIVPLAIPITIAFSILRYRLWQVDVWINRAVVYGGLTFLVTALYALTVGGTAVLFQSQVDTVSSIMALIIIGLILPPAYRHWQKLINRLVPLPEHAMPDVTADKMAVAPSSTHLYGRSRFWAQLAWGGSTLLSLTVFITSLQVAADTHLFAQMPQLAAEIDIALFSVFANNHLLNSATTLIISYTQFLVCLGLGLFLFWRKTNDWMAILSANMLISIGVGFSAAVFFLPVLRPSWHIPVSLLQIILFTGLLWFLYLFPNGRFTPYWTRPAAILWSLYALSWLIWPQLNPHRSGNFTALLIFIGWMWTGIIAQMSRYRQTKSEDQQQQKWVLMGFFINFLCFGLLVVSSAIGLNQQWVALAPFPFKLMNTLFGLSSILIPITITIAILRYRLWEVDVWLNRTVVYGGLTAVILTLYGLSVGLLSSLIPNNSSQLIPFIALTAAALTTIPAHRHLQTLANRWLPLPSKPSDTPLLPRSSAPVSEATLFLRLAHLLWYTLCLFLLWQLVQVLGNLPAIMAFQRNEWAFQESLKALPGVSVEGYVLYFTVIRLATAVFYWLTAVLIFRYRRDDWFALAVSFLLLLLPFSLALGDITNDPLQSLGMFALLALLLLPFFFPDGRLVPQSTRWRISLITYLLLAPALTFTLFPFLMPHLDREGIQWVSLITSIAAIFVAGMVSQIVRYQRMDKAARQQIKWVLIGGFGSLAIFFLWTMGWVVNELDDPYSLLITLHLNFLATTALPLTIGYAILRHRLWEMDVWINRTLVFGGLTLLVTAVYILSVGLLSNLFQSGSSLTLSILATGLIAILFNPVRQRLQTAVNRLMYGERDDPITVLTTLGKRLEETAVPSQTLPALVETIAQTLKLPYVAVAGRGAGEQRGGKAGEMLAEYHLPLATRHLPLATFPLIYQSETIGQLLVSLRAPGETFNPAEMRLLENVARQAGTAVYAAQLTHDLQRSRERLVTAREEERRRIRRDLHDGLGPQLATLSLKVDTARNYLAHDVPTADHLLSELKGEIQSAISEIRRLVNELRPAALDQLGLVSALQEHIARQSGNGRLHIALTAPDDLPPLPAAAEVAAYRIALEAITNTVRHAHANTCQLCLEFNDSLQLEIRDDGIGLPLGYQAGIGLSSMRERTAELGGAFHIESTPGQGTVISVQLPLAHNQQDGQ